MAITPRSIDAGVGIGEIFVDKYRVDAILGHGGMGVVAACTHLALNERVAIKMLRKDVLDDADAVERFMREAQAAVKLKSEFVARVTDVGRSRSNVPYMVMEYLEGHDLGELLDERGSLGMRWAIELTLQACEALAEAHSLGIVHRDVKPTNLFVTWRPDGSSLVKVLDFGISKALTGHAMQLTQTQSLLGTPAYMSPEQMRSARMVDARTDIWSLGTVLYEMIEGRRPFEAESFSEMCVKVAVDPPAAMKTAPPELQQVVMRCLEKAPEQRYLSMAELARDLVPFSSDPHQAQILVERMTRTLRRSQVQPIEWSPSSSGTSSPVIQLWTGERSAEPGAGDSGPTRIARSSASTPAVVPERGSGPTPAPLAAILEGGSGPAAAGQSARISGRARAELPRRNTGSQPALSETLAVARPRSRRGIAIATAVVAAAAIGVVISLLGSRPSPSRPAATPAATRSTGGTDSTGDAAPHSAAAQPADTAAQRDAAQQHAAAQPSSPVDTAAQPGNTAVQPVRGTADTASGTTAADAVEPAAGTTVIVPPPDVAPHPGATGVTGRDAKAVRTGTGTGNRPAGRPNSGGKPAGGASPAKHARDCVFADAHGDACVDSPGSGAH